MNKEAIKIQRRWRGWDVRKHEIVSKLRSIKKIENEVDVLESSPATQEILNVSLTEPLPNLDTQYVGKVPRCVMALEHELTAKLLLLDGISGGGDLVRQRRKALVSHIEKILSRVDPIKKAYNNSPNHPPKVDTMETEPTPTPTSTTGDSPTDTTSDTATDTTATSSSTDEMDIEETADKKKQPVNTTTTPTTTPATSSAGTRDTTGSAFVDSMGSMAIEDVSDTPSVSTPAPIVENITEPVVESIASSTSLSSSKVPPLKHLCYQLCDRLIKKALL